MTKISPFLANYGIEMRIGSNIRKKGKVKKVIEFMKRMKKVYEKAGVVLKKLQEDMKRQTNKSRKESKD